MLHGEGPLTTLEEQALPAPRSPGAAGQDQDRLGNAQRLHWWVEVLIIAVFYGAYTAIRDLNGRHAVAVTVAFQHARDLISAERWLGIFKERDIQRWLLPHRTIVSLLNDYYGSAHFIAVVGVLLLLFFKYPERYPRMRNTLALTTLLALIGFYCYPVMPPRLLPSSYGFVDTLRVIGGLWNFNSGPVNAVTNQFAAMPSLHTGWSTWCAAALVPSCKRWWTKAALFLYPALTVFCIVVTANHYFADAAGGLLDLGISYLLARWLTAAWDRRKVRRAQGAGPGYSGGGSV